MKLIFIMLLFSYNAYSTVYYVSNAGSDGAAGTSTGTAWATIPKVNSTATTGDSVLFNSGDSWNAQIKPAANGIYYGSYGTGVRPLITAFQSQGSFSNVTGNIWRAVATNATTKLNTVLLNGTLALKGRFPNTGYLTFQSFSTNTSITSSSLTGTPSYVGKIVVVRTSRAVIDTSTVATQSTSTITFTTPITYTPNLGGNGFFFQNDSTFVDTLNEYSFNKVTKALIVYSVGSPTVLISTIDTLVWISKKSNIVFDGLSFTGANINAFQIDTCTTGTTIKNCSIKYCGSDGISAFKSGNISVLNDSIQYCLNTGVNFSPLLIYPTISGLIPNACDSAKITGNYIKNIGYIAGMGLNGPASTSDGIWAIGSRDTISNNRIDSAGYCSIQTFGMYREVKNNYITNFCFVKDDGGGIKSGIITGFPTNYDSASTVRSNIILNGIGALTGTTAANLPSAGLYPDNFDMGILFDSNTVYNCVYAGILHNLGNSCRFFDNTVVNNAGYGIAIIGVTTSQVFGENIKRNIFYSLSASQFCIYRDATDLNESIDSNYYLRPIDETNKMRMASTSYTLPAWVSATGYDSHSSGTPAGIIVNNYQLLLNPTTSSASVLIPTGTWVDPKGNFYYGYSSNNRVTLPPFGSLIILKLFADVYSGTISGNQNKIR